MPRRKRPVPKYCHHTPSDQAYVRIPDGSGRRRVVYLGKFNSPESLTEYRRILAELEVGSPTVVGTSESTVRDLTVAEVMLAFLRHAERYYVRPDGTQTHEVAEYRQVIRVAVDLYGMLPAKEFGPLALKAVRQKMVDAGLCRSLVNQRTARVRRAFKWAVSEELIPAAVHQGLASVAGLQKGRGVGRERAPVLPVEDWVVAATLPYLTPTVAAMVRFQSLTGCRPGEVCLLRAAEVDTCGEVWVYRPSYHKLAFRGHRRAVAIGPRAQGILSERWPASPAEYAFSPRRSVAAFHASRTDARKTPKYASHVRRNVAKRKSGTSLRPGEKYTATSYGRAIAKAVTRANAARERHLADCGPNLPFVPHWAPNQIRHAHGTEVRKRFGLEAAQVVLGHAKADITQTYAERDDSLAAKVAAQIG